MSLFGPTRKPDDLCFRGSGAHPLALTTARVNAARLAQYKSQTVRLTGKVVRMEGDTAIIEASDGGQVSYRPTSPRFCIGTDQCTRLQVSIKLHREANISDPFVEILGKVNDDLSIKVFSSMNLGSDLGTSL